MIIVKVQRFGFGEGCDIYSNEKTDDNEVLREVIEHLKLSKHIQK